MQEVKLPFAAREALLIPLVLPATRGGAGKQEGGVS